MREQGFTFVDIFQLNATHFPKGPVSPPIISIVKLAKKNPGAPENSIMVV